MTAVHAAADCTGLAAAAFLAAALLSKGADRPFGEPSTGRSPVLARNGMVATSQPLAAQAGLDILKRGGNAFDAAVATAAVLAVVEPMMTGPGGDLFVLAHVAKNGRPVGLNASGFSPHAIGEEFFAVRDLKEVPVTGPYSVTVPGAVDGWAELLARHGSISLAEALEPAIDYAENGFPVSEIIGGDWEKSGPEHASKEPFASIYLRNGLGYGHGSVFRNPDLAKTFRQVADGGRDAFYKGEFAVRMVGHLNEQGWPLSLGDMVHQHADWIEPLQTSYRGVNVLELPPNGQGLAALQMLNILEDFDLRELGFQSAECLHLLVEAKKLAFADLGAWLADPEQANLPTERLISKEYAAEQRRRINPKKAAAGLLSGIPRGGEQGETVYLSVVDKDRNAVSFINSIFHAFGSGEVVPGTGVILQNRGALFTLEPGHPNTIGSRKRPFHTIIPAMTYRDGKPWTSFGVMGGSMQPQGHVQILVHQIDYGMDVQVAGEAPRCNHLADGDLALESGIPEATAQALTDLGHEVTVRRGSFGGYQSIEIDWQRGTLIGGTDPRKDGCVAAW